MPKIQVSPSDFTITDAGGGNFKATNRLTGVSVTGNAATINALIKQSLVSYEEAEFQVATNRGITGLARRDGSLVGCLERFETQSTAQVIDSTDNGNTFIHTGSGNVNYTIPTGLQFPFTLRIIQAGTGAVTLLTSGLTTVGDTATVSQGDMLEVRGYAVDTYIIKKL